MYLFLELNLFKDFERRVSYFSLVQVGNLGGSEDFLQDGKQGYILTFIVSCFLQVDFCRLVNLDFIGDLYIDIKRVFRE